MTVKSSATVWVTGSMQEKGKKTCRLRLLDRFLRTRDIWLPARFLLDQKAKEGEHIFQVPQWWAHENKLLYDVTEDVAKNISKFSTR